MPVIRNPATSVVVLRWPWGSPSATVRLSRSGHGYGSCWRRSPLYRMIPRIIRSRSAFIDKHEASGFQIDLTIEPVVTLLQDVGSVLLDRMSRLFTRHASAHEKNGEVRT